MFGLTFALFSALTILALLDRAASLDERVRRDRHDNGVQG